jgi:hypothetical protein
MINEIRTKFASEKFEFSKHATDQSILRDIRVSEIRQAIEQGEIIEDYPNDKYGPSCLIAGYSKGKRPIHIHCSYPSRSIIKIITVNEPDENEWIDF